MASGIRLVDANMVWEAIKQLKPKLVKVPSLQFGVVKAVRRDKVVNYIVRRYQLDADLVIVEIHQLALDNEITLLTGKDGKKYIDANIGKQG